MNKITPLKPDAQGDAVVDLHLAVARLMVLGEIGLTPSEMQGAQTRLAIERKARTYGDTTQRLIVIFQKTHDLHATGEVDEATADKINEILFGKSEPGPQPTSFGAPPPNVVAGTVQTEDKLPAPNRLVRISHLDIRGAIRLGQDTTGPDGRYTIRYDPLPDVEVLHLQASVVGDDGETIAENSANPSDAAIQLIDLTVPAVQTPANMARIDGRIVLEYGQPAENVTLLLYRKDFGGESKALDKTTTREHGVYSFAYDREKVTGLEIRALDAAGKEIPLSTTRFPAASDSRTVINLVAPKSVKPLAPEFERLAKDLQPQIGDIQMLRKAREDAEQRDLTTLNRATGWDARLLALASSAAKVGADTQLSQKALYGLFRVGLPSDKVQLAYVTPETLDRAFDAARKNGIVDMTDVEIAVFKKQFAAFAPAAALSVPAPGSTFSYKRVIDASGVSAESLNKFAPVFLSHRGDASELWKKAKEAGVSDADILVLQQHGKMAFLTANNAPLLERLRAKSDTPSKLVANDFHKAATWKAELKAIAATDDALSKVIPPIYTGESLDDRLNAYADDMARKVRLSYPTEVLSRTIAADANDEFRLGAARESARVFLDKAAPLKFKLGRTPVETFIRDNPAVVDGMTAEQTAHTRSTMKTLQRVSQMTPSDGSMKTLMQLGFTSASQVARYTRDGFLEQFGGRFPSLDEAQTVYDKAVQIDAVTYNIFSIVRQVDNTPPLPVTAAPPAAAQEAKNNLIKQFPTMESLFGSMDFCECEHCNSVLSPAAYLVDLLQFIDPDDLTWQNFRDAWRTKHNNEDYTAKYKKAYDALIARRPDIPFIQLTCENTNVALPYIDVVNEILEYFVAKHGLQADAAQDTGSATSEELVAEPQHVISDAYDVLLGAKYPLNLPFDLWLETVRSFTDYFETPLWKILDVFRPGDELFGGGHIYDRAAIYAESLGLSPSEYALFTDPNALATWFQLYGFDSENAAKTVATDASGQRIDLNSAKALSRRLGVTYHELIAILKTNFVNPRLQMLAVLQKSGLSVKDAIVHETDKGLLAPPPDGLTPSEKTRRDEVAAFETKLDQTTARYPGFDARQWFGDAVGNNAFADVLILADPAGGCDFDQTTLRYASGAPADAIAFLKINLFVRLWRKLQWTIAETDRALSVFIPSNTPFDAAHVGQSPLKSVLLYMAHLKQLEQGISAGKNARIKLLTLWSAMDSNADTSLYAQLFLTRSMLKADPAFDDPRGLYLTKPNVFLKDHLPALRAAVGVTADEIKLILRRSGQQLDDALLSMDNVSLIYRHQLLAKLLKLSVSDLLTLIALSRLDPFRAVPAAAINDIANDVPLTNTLRFVEVARQLKEAGFKVADLDYLLRQEFDPNGPYTTVANGTLPLLKSLADGVRAIRAEHAVPADPGSMTEEAFRQKLGLVLPPDIVQRLLSMLNGSVEFTVTRPALAANKLDPATFAAEPAIRQVHYNDTRHEQSLTFRGMLFDGESNALKAAFPAPLFASLLDDVQAAQRAFFAQHLQRQADAEPASGFLDAADYDLLFGPAPPPPGGATDLEKQRLEQQHIADQKRRLAVVFLPFLQRRLIRVFLIQTLAAENAADPSLIEYLITAGDVLGEPPLLEAFTGTGAKGVTINYYASNDASGNPSASGIAGDADTHQPFKPVGANSARIEGYLEVPVAGAYRFFVTLDKANAEAETRFDHLAAPLVKATAANDGAELSEFIELKARVPYHFTIVIRKLGVGDARVQVQGETMPKGALSQLTLYAQSALEGGRRAAVLLNKVIRIMTTLALTEREMRYFTAHAADFADLDLSKLPVDDDIAAADAAMLLGQLLRLAAYKRLKLEMAGGTDLIGIFETSAVNIDDAYALIASLTRREATVVGETARRLFAVPRFINEVDVQRLWDALQIVERFGVPLLAIAGERGVAPNLARGWITIVSPLATPNQRFTIAHDLKEALRARFDTEAWQQVAQPIFDKLRRRQRDALVAHVMQTRGFARVEQLYEYFLIDPAMEPVVLTSRIRLASSSLQLFIQRCLLNLELDVHPTAINAAQWEWMKRYRVWEANRKIFLFPENWLEPEFRDDRTHLYTELESTLLQGDVSRDHVNEAFFTYLKKLDEIARLNIVAMHCEDNPNPALNKIHVIGRTYDQTPKYFYRRYAQDMWTPWEPITADVEGDHLAPIVWRDRLYLFWITFIDRPAPTQTPADSGDKPGTMGMSALITSLNSRNNTKIVEAHLHWSEYLNGAWGPRQSAYPAAGFAATVPLTFNRNEVFIHTSLDATEDPGVNIHLTVFNGVYHLSSPNAPPQPGTIEAAPPVPYETHQYGPNRYFGSGALRVRLKTKITTEDGQASQEQVETLPILNKAPEFTILPIDNYITLGTREFASLVAPVFYQDAVNTFFIEPSLIETTLEEWKTFVIPPTTRKPDWEDPDWWKHEIVYPVIPDILPPNPVDPEDPIWRDPFERGKGVTDPVPDWLTDSRTVIDVGDGRLIDAGGLRDTTTTRDADFQQVKFGRGDMTVIGKGGLSSDLLDSIQFDTNALRGGSRFSGGFGGSGFGG